MSALSAVRLGLVRCHDCGLLCRAAVVPAGHRAHCPRCSGVLHGRKLHGLQRSWALLIAAAIFYVPANVLPVSVITWFGETNSDTIMSGVRGLFASGDTVVAVVLFACSICVPALKLLVLAWLLASVHFRWAWRPVDRTKAYRIVELVGRWSMLDIFVIAVLASLGNLGAIATIRAGPGAISFCIVVVLTMLAAESFDPRLAWDALEPSS